VLPTVFLRRVCGTLRAVPDFLEANDTHVKASVSRDVHVVHESTTFRAGFDPSKAETALRRREREGGRRSLALHVNFSAAKKSTHQLSTENAMKLNRIYMWIVSAAALTVMSLGNALAVDDMLTVADPETMGKWYGRAGGLVGSDLVMAPATPIKPRARVRITFDKEVAERTNMQREEAAAGGVAITYDKAVAERTNMPRGDNTKEPTRVVGPSDKAKQD
jgi:hypothetical protein